MNLHQKALDDPYNNNKAVFHLYKNILILMLCPERVTSSTITSDVAYFSFSSLFLSFWPLTQGFQKDKSFFFFLSFLDRTDISDVSFYSWLLKGC